MKPKIVLLLLINVFLFNTFSFSQASLPWHSIELSAGYSNHGSGDMKGIVTGVPYTKYLSKKISLNYDLRNSINHSRNVIIVTNSSVGQLTDASVRFTTAGLQLGVNVQASFLRIYTMNYSLGWVALGGFNLHLTVLMDIHFISHQQLECLRCLLVMIT
ncbi:MAG: hypothetical protein JWN76_2444 [Chitinophagaceae bacterium]|nr:hypothetical protein [Chitinophagaceae bacterium]